jgi:hypothetical protein
MKVANMMKKNDNPFYGRGELLALLQTGTRSNVSKEEFLNVLGSAYHSLQNKEQRELFYVILFSFGDIPNRQHNIFKKEKVDGGGVGSRDPFMWAMEWMLAVQPAQFEKFRDTDMFRQFVGLFNILATQVRTEKGTTKVTKTLNMLEGQNLVKLAEYLARIINGANPVEKTLIAKWLVYPRTSKRQKYSKKTKEFVKGGRPLQDETKQLMDLRSKLYYHLSEIMGWAVIQHKHNMEFVGLKDWKKEWNGELESVLFSTGKISEFDKEQFFKWLDVLPSGARYRVRRRLLGKDDEVKVKWKSKEGEYLGVYFVDWEHFKKGKQKEERVLQEKVRTGTATKKDVEKLEKVKKEAKVTTGGTNLFDVLSRMISGVSTKNEAQLLSDALMEKSIFEVPVLPILDGSASMGFGNGIPAFMATVIATLVLLKNPSPELDNILVRFGNRAEFLTDGSVAAAKQNRFMQSQMSVVEKLVDRKQSFLENYERMTKYCQPNMGGTDFSSVADAFKGWVDSAENDSAKRVRIEMIQQFPVFLVVSDGDFNGQGGAQQTMAVFQQKMKQWFGWAGVVVIWDVKQQRSSSFKGLENVIHIKEGFNASTVNQVFTKIHDLDIIDVYTPLKSIYASNRYELIKQNTL